MGEKNDTFGFLLLRFVSKEKEKKQLKQNMQ